MPDGFPGHSDHRLAGLAFLIPVTALLLFRVLLPANICDDAYISLRTATHLSTGQGMVFNVGERVFSVTTPLWAGSSRMGYEFARVFFGRSTYWFVHSIHYWPSAGP